MTDYDKGYYDAMKYIGLKIDFVCNEIGYFGYSFDPNYSVPESFCKELKKIPTDSGKGKY